MVQISQETTERLIDPLKDRREKDKEVIALIRTLLAEREQNGRAAVVIPTPFDDLERAREEARQTRAHLYEEQRLSRIIREESDALVVLTGQLLVRVQKAEALVAVGQPDEPRTPDEPQIQLLVRSPEDAEGTPLANLTPQQQPAGRQ